MVKIPKRVTADEMIGKDSAIVFQYLYEGVEKIGSHSEAAINHMPVVDIYSTSDSVIVEVELPGIRKDEIDISILKNTLTIRGLKYECFDEKKINFVCMERSFGKIFRILEIPCPVDTSRTKAVFREGLLTIILPKVEEKRGIPRSINIET